MGFTTPDYSSSMPYSSSTRGTRDYCQKNLATGHIDLIISPVGHKIDVCAQNRGSVDPWVGGGNTGDPFGFQNRHGPTGGGGSNAGPLMRKRVTCNARATFTAVSADQAHADGALYSKYPNEPGVGGSIKGGKNGTVAVQMGFLGLSTPQLRTYGTQIFVTPSDQDTIAKYGGPTGPLSVSDYGDENIQNTKGLAFDIYRFPTTKDAFGFGTKKMGVSISFPASSGGFCP
jgi:hypothetical protein